MGYLRRSICGPYNAPIAACGRDRDGRLAFRKDCLILECKVREDFLNCRLWETSKGG